MTSTIEWANRYRSEHGWHVVPVPRGTKNPGKGWQNRTADNPHGFKADGNISLLPGTRSGGVVDIDLDIPEARFIADLPQFLGGVIGWRRQSYAEPGHRLVRCPDAPDQAIKYDFRGAELEALGGDKACVLEMRGGKCHTVIPPSVLKRGTDLEPLLWVNGNLPEMDWGTLQHLLGIIAVLAVLTRYYPDAPGGRDDYAMHLAGALVDMGLSEQADEIVEAIARFKGDNEPGKRAATARNTVKRAADGVQINGLNGMIEHAGITALRDRLYKWLDRPTGPRQPDLPDDAFCINTSNDADSLTRLHALIGSRLPDKVFLQPGALVRARVLTKKDEQRGIIVHPGSVEVARVDKHWLAVSLSAAGAKFFKKTAKGDQLVPASAVNYDQLLALPEMAPFDQLRGISRVPTITRDAPGYDPESKMLLFFEPNDFPRVPERPTEGDARRALEVVLRPLRRFPFDGKEGEATVARSVALSAILSGVARPSLIYIPLHAVSAPAAGTGKTKLLDIVGIIATGAQVAQVSFTANSEEMEKRLGAILLRGAPVINIDNVSRGAPLGGDFLCTALTSPQVTIRPLGVSQAIEVDSRSLLLASGNNLMASGDLVRRMLHCRLIRPGVEKPERISFSFDPIEEAKQDRARLVSAVLTILRAYHVAGRPKPAGHTALGSFEDWDDLVRGALLWLGQPDPLASQDDLQQEDEERENLDALLMALGRGFGSGHWFTVKDISTDVQLRDELASLFWDGHWSPKKAGRMLRRYHDRLIHGRMLQMRRNPAGNVQEYCIVSDVPIPRERFPF
jgi:hypothetical protein